MGNDPERGSAQRGSSPTVTEGSLLGGKPAFTVGLLPCSSLTHTLICVVDLQRIFS